MKSFTCNPLALQPRLPAGTTQAAQLRTASRYKLESVSRLRRDGSLLFRPLQGGRIQLECEMAGRPGLGTTESRRALWQCRAGREPDKVVEIVKEELEIDVVRDGWQWTKTNQELVIIGSIF